MTNPDNIEDYAREVRVRQRERQRAFEKPRWTIADLAGAVFGVALGGVMIWLFLVLAFGL